ncbi:MAG: LytTR family transcriptional regulator DNA-binding domain-containing protein [Spirosomataceae bacterium]
MYKTILIDDEPIALGRLKRLLAQFGDTFDIVAEANNGHEGLESIENHQPDLIFLDIEMPLMSGFEMLSKLTYMPLVVFVTAYDQYAIKAFEEKSIDYLLKPVEKERLARTVEKLKSLHSKQRNPFTQANLIQLIEQMRPQKELHSMSVKSGDKILFIPLIEISYFQAEDKYVFLNTTDGKQFLVSYTLSSLEEKLPMSFVRVSRSAIVNSSRIKELEKYFNGKYLVVMNDKKNTTLESGTTYHENLRQLMDLW